MNKTYGLLLTIFIALIAFSLSNVIPIGAVAIAIIFGAIINNTFSISKKFTPGITFSEKTLLAIAISLLGIHLDFNVLYELGFTTIFIIVFTLIATLVFTKILAKRLKFENNFALILGIGNGVCGSAAIGATKDIVKLNEEKSALAIAIVNLLGTIGLFILPLIGLLLGFSDVEIGLLLGNTLQSVGHAVAAGFGVNETVGQSSTIVKMGRILLLTPIIFWLIYTVSKKDNVEQESTKKIQVPIFVIGFVFSSIVASSQILSQEIVDIIAFVCKVTLVIAMSAIGLKISFKTIKEKGFDALVLAGFIFKFQIILSMLLIAIL